MPNVSRDTASETIALEGLDVRVEHLEGGYSVCFESHTADADLAACSAACRRSLPAAPLGLRAGGHGRFRFPDREETFRPATPTTWPGHTPVHYAGAEIVEFSPTDVLGQTIPVVLGNLRS